MSRIADTAPTHCSACFAQKLGKRHVDFDVMYDGPVIPDGGVYHSIDDLIICEDCLREAGMHVGIGVVEVAEAERDAARLEADEAIERATAAETKLEQVKAMFETLGVPVPDPTAIVEPKVEPVVEQPQPVKRGRRKKAAAEQSKADEDDPADPAQATADADGGEA